MLVSAFCLSVKHFFHFAEFIGIDFTTSVPIDKDINTPIYRIIESRHAQLSRPHSQKYYKRNNSQDKYSHNETSPRESEGVTPMGPSTIKTTIHNVTSYKRIW